MSYSWDDYYDFVEKLNLVYLDKKILLIHDKFYILEDYLHRNHNVKCKITTNNSTDLYKFKVIIKFEDEADKLNFQLQFV